MTNIKTFSSNIEGHVETYGVKTYGEPSGNSPDRSPDSFETDSFETNPLIRRKLYGKWMLLSTGAGLEPGYKRVKGVLKVEPTEADAAADLFFAGKKLTDEQKKILQVGWPKIFEGVSLNSENQLSKKFQDPETTQKAREFHWKIWEKKIPRDERGKIDPRVLGEEKRAFEAYWKELLRVMNKMHTPGRSWGIKYGEFYHKDKGWY